MATPATPAAVATQRFEQTRRPRHGLVFFSASIALLCTALVIGIAASSSEWVVPLLAGAIAAFFAGLYQRWWVRSVFEQTRTEP